MQILFSYFVMTTEMTIATDTLYNASPTNYDFGIFGVIEDSTNIIFIVTLWLGNGLIYFPDMTCRYGGDRGGEGGKICPINP